MQTEITIAHLTDNHINPDNTLVRDIDVRRNFDIILHDIVGAAPDLIVLGGDLAATAGEIEAYEWIRPRLDRAGIPYLLIPGNHDSIDNLTRVFDLQESRKGDSLYFSKRVNDLKLVFLDTSEETVSHDQLRWLEQEVRETGTQALLFMHHPPLFCNCTFMDTKYPLRNRDEVFDTIRQLPAIRHVFCGHYHTEKTVREDEITVYLTPSTMLQIDPSTAGYVVGGTIPGWRLIRWNGTRLETTVRYVMPE